MTNDSKAVITTMLQAALKAYNEYTFNSPVVLQKPVSIKVSYTLRLSDCSETTFCEVEL